MGAERRALTPGPALIAAAILVLGPLAPARKAAAAPPWVDRRLTPPAGDWAFDFGLGLGHVGDGGEASAVGVNAEIAVGLTSRVELGVRSGVRFGDPGERAIRADQYGRLFDRQTFGTGSEIVANPEVRLRGALVRGDVVELALEGRLVAPFEDGTRAGALFGVPLAFHLGDRVRLDTGPYVPVLFTDPDAYFEVRLPLDVWIQASSRVWVGIMTGLVLSQPGKNVSHADLSLGLGLGYQVTHSVDLKAMFLFPSVNGGGGRDFGAGAGVEFRVE